LPDADSAELGVNEHDRYILGELLDKTVHHLKVTIKPQNVDYLVRTMRPSDEDVQVMPATEVPRVTRGEVSKHAISALLASPV